MIELKSVTKSYSEAAKVVDRLDLKVYEGEFVILIGESGCGKTTTMKMLNRLVEPTEGQIIIDGQDIMKMDPIQLRRRIGYVIQKVGLFPHMTVGENIEVIPKLMKWDKEKRKARTMELLDMVGLPGETYYDRYPDEMSGGQQQRIGVARALATNPDIILMDEPFSALDPMTREQLQDELLKLQDELHKTIIFVTHDMDEALKLGDKIAVMKDGKILQYDTPERILKKPKDAYVEFFVGKDRLWKSPEMVYAKDIMRKNVARTSMTRTVSHALELMKKRGVNTLAVVEKQSDQPQEVLGFITRKELAKAMNEDMKIKDIMNKDVPVISEDMNMVDVLDYLAQNKLQHVYVVDEEKKLSGIVSESSIVNLITEMITDYEESKEEKKHEQ
ncbi:betaine/proline/choline family ABC transporter ATP-binding protein [Anaerotalea alkaliphila]|uniref:Quaternary amine transport ATP-binding protein n=1 Tax=Anaerotalea alkaliphila TaxID=2662126 RepID=A0A7X5HTZ3_9FIRM|nr:betaine/proline/choline family ABC transporter ATP-binding protein [Anaerotalea alkaliphila]NDL66635.1 betaine/proline/choline family ABC transporter ATP-binding protein [Anaerotalea alkaliphila]